MKSFIENSEKKKSQKIILLCFLYLGWYADFACASKFILILGVIPSAF